MAISPVSDIVMDVVQAAEPAAVAAARARLSEGAAPGGETFSLEVAGRPAPRIEKPGLEPFQKFEAMVLGSFVEAMLPDDAESAYGGGMAGSMWKGLLAEKLGTALAESGGIGIAERMLPGHYVEDGKRVSVGPAAHPPSQAEAGNSMLQTSLVAEFQRRALRTASDS